MSFLRIESALNTCQAHLSSLDSADPNSAEIEAHIVSSLILLIVSEYEELIEGMFVDRASLCGDTHVISYVRTMISQKLRSPDLRKIRGILGQFGSDYKQNFNAKIENTEYEAAWGNIMQARHAIVHKSGTLNITFGELVASYPKTKIVISELKNTLGIP
jgi:hypothetical protein